MNLNFEIFPTQKNLILTRKNGLPLKGISRKQQKLVYVNIPSVDVYQIPGKLVHVDASAFQAKIADM